MQGSSGGLGCRTSCLSGGFERGWLSAGLTRAIGFADIIRSSIRLAEVFVVVLRGRAWCVGCLIYYCLRNRLAFWGGSSDVFGGSSRLCVGNDRNLIWGGIAGSFIVCLRSRHLAM